MGMKEQTTARDPVASSLWGGDCIVGFSVSAVTGDPERISQRQGSRGGLVRRIEVGKLVSLRCLLQSTWTAINHCQFPLHL